MGDKLFIKKVKKVKKKFAYLNFFNILPVHLQKKMDS